MALQQEGKSPSNQEKALSAEVVTKYALADEHLQVIHGSDANIRSVDEYIQSSPEGKPPPSGSSQEGQPPPSGSSQGGHPPPSGSSQGGHPPPSGSSQGGQPPPSGSSQGGQPPPSGSSQGGQAPPSGFSQGGQPPPSGSSQGGHPPPSGSSQGKQAPPSGSSQGGQPPPSGSSQGGQPPPSGSSQGGQAPPSGSSQGGQPPPSGSSQGGQAPPSGSSQGGQAPPSGSSQGGQAPPSGSSRQGQPPPSGSSQEGQPPTSGSSQGGQPPPSGSSQGGQPPPSGFSQGGQPPPSGSSQGGRVPPSGSSQGGRAPPSGSSQGGQPPPSGSSQGGQPPPSGSSQGGRAPPSGSSQGGQPPPSGFSQGGQPPPSGSSQGGRAPPSGSSQGGQAPPSGSSQGGQAPPSGSSQGGQPPLTADDVPTFLLCPLTKKLMKDPVLTELGKTYERSAIEEYYRKNKQPERIKKLYPNIAIKHLVEQFEHGELFADKSCLCCGASPLPRSEKLVSEPVTSPLGMMYEKKLISSIIKKKQRGLLKELGESENLKVTDLYSNEVVREACSFVSVPMTPKIKQIQMHDVTLVPQLRLTTKILPRPVPVCFHLMIPCEQWNVQDNFTIVINFDVDRTPFYIEPNKIERVSNINGLLHYMVTISIDRLVIKQEAMLLYQYCVSMTSKTQKVSKLSVREESFPLHWFSTEFRCLQLPLDSTSSTGGIHHIFDGKAHFLEVHDESASVANQECLNGYMHMFTQATCTCVSSSGSDDCRQCSTKLYQMYCMFERLCNDMENKEGASRIRFSKPATINKKFSGIYRGVLDWIGKWIGKSTHVTEANPPVTALLMLCFIARIVFQWKKLGMEEVCGVMSALFRLLRVEIDVEQKIVHCYDVINHLTDVQFRDIAEHCLGQLLSSKLCRDVATKEWMMIASWYHFVTAKLTPFENVAPGKIWWASRGPSPKASLGGRSENDRVINQLFHSHHFEADPLLLPFCFELLPNQDHDKIVRNMKPDYSLHWLIKTLNQSHFYRYSSHEELRILESISEAIKETNSITDCSDGEKLFNTAIEILDKFVRRKLNFEKTGTFVDSEVEIVCVSLSLVLNLIIEIEFDEKAFVTDTTKGKLQKIRDLLAAFFENAFNSEYFGGMGKKYDLEFEIWQKFVRLPECRLQKLWIQEVIKPMITKRISNVDDSGKLILFWRCGSDDSVLNDIVEYETAKVIEQEMEKDPSSQRILSELEKHGSRINSKYFELALSIALCSHRKPLADHTLDLRDLLSWPYWPLIIKTSEKKFLFLTEEDKTTCEEATRFLATLASSLRSQEIKVKDLNQICGKKLDFRKLVVASRCIGLEPESIQRELADTERMLLKYESQRQLLAHVCGHLAKVDENMPGLESLRVKVLSDAHNELSVCDVCRPGDIDGVYTFPVFKGAEVLTPMLRDFKLLATDYKNDIFDIAWNKEVKNFKKQLSDLTFEVVVNEIWRAVYEQCESLLLKLKDRSVELSVIDERFELYEIAVLEKQVLRLCNGFVEITNEQEGGNDWVKPFIQDIQNYRAIKRYLGAAIVFCDLQEKFGLTGDFEGAARLIKVVSPQSAKSLCLRDVDLSIVETAQLFKETASHPTRIECLEKVAECHDMLSWIRSVGQDLSDLQAFVTLALETGACGEDNFSKDRMSNLRAIGSDFASLIFDLPSSTGLSELVQKCHPVWEALKSRNDLPKLLEDCYKDLKWYKEVKNTQGDVETGSYRQLENILQYGTFTIGTEVGSRVDIEDISEDMLGADSALVNTCIASVICLRLQDTTGQHKLPKNVYTVGELSDLESRLVLITGKESQSRADVTHFLKLLSLVRRIAEALIQLQQNGYSNYIGWCLRFSCREVDTELTVLSQIAQHMNRVLVSWSNNVDIARRMYYELNYYTTKQLLYLRHALRKLQCNYSDLTKEGVSDSTDLFNGLSKSQLLSLLRSTSKDVSGDVLYRLMSCEEEKTSKDAETVGTVQVSDFSVLAGGDDTSRDTPELPEEKEQKLTEMFEGDQYRLFCRLIEYYGHNKLLAKEATKQFDDEDDANDWCEDNVDNPEYTTLSQSNTGDDEVEQPTVLVDNFELMQTSSSHQNSESRVGHLQMEEINDTLHINQAVYHVQDQTEPRISIPSLDELGSFLSKLSETKANIEHRRFPLEKGLLIGVPNLLVTNEENVLKTVISIYMEGLSLPFPTLEEVVVCTTETTDEEITLFWRRATQDSEQRLFCLVHAEKLAYTVIDKSMNSLLELIRDQKDCRLVIVCSNMDESRSPMISRLHLYRRNFAMRTDKEIENYIKRHLASPKGGDNVMFAPTVDKDRLTVRVVSSKRSGMGKSLYVKRLSEQLGKNTKSRLQQFLVTIPVQGPCVSSEKIISLLEAQRDDSENKIYLLDIDPTVMNDAVNPLFCLLILEGLADSQGRVWRRHPSQLYCIEVTQEQCRLSDTHGKTSLQALLEVLPTVECISPIQTLQLSTRKAENKIRSDLKELQSAEYQRVYQYLKRHECKGDLENFNYKGGMEDEENDWLRIICKYCGVLRPSWKEVWHFVRFLNIQLFSAESSVYLKHSDKARGLKAFVVKFLIRMSTDFATSSLQGEVELEEGQVGPGDEISLLQIAERNNWEQRPHPYIFFNQDKSSATFIGFAFSDSGDLTDPRNGEVIEENFASPDLVSLLKQLGIQEQKESAYLARLGRFLDIEEVENPDTSYVLTHDNFMKILGILMRFRCGIPVVLMGETGCGKTSLVRYMCAVCAKCAGQDHSTMLILKVHGGTTEKMIVDKVKEAIHHSETNCGVDTVLFFDEANTTDAIGLIKEVICDRRFLGKSIPNSIKFVAACNPYRKHSEAMIKKLESAGLGYYVKDSRLKLGTIPLRQLVYRVRDLPPSMRPLVYDFGRLTNETERQYTEKIVQNHVEEKYVKSVTGVLSSCQQYMKGREDECSFVSLRDVERCMLVFSFFKNKMANFKQLINERGQKETGNDESFEEIKDVTRALVISISVCYHARLQERMEFEQEAPTWFTEPLTIPGGVKRFCNEIRWCQEVVLNSLKIPDNVALNTALRENVFMMAICIELRIPLFLVGKPGSSKSLAKTILSTSMQGQASSHPLLKTFKEIQMFSYQCSKYSTPESVIEVFSTAKEFQEKQDVTRYVSVVVLDEVGLAEDAPSLPLKALHPLLEDGSTGGDSKDEVIKREHRVSFVGISNWALDPAKMNRGVMVTRGDPDSQELVNTAKGICSNAGEDPVANRLEPYFISLANSYRTVCEKVNSEREFYGLRDFYSLIKMLYWISKKSGQLNSRQLEYVVKRNFGGTQLVDTWEIFKQTIAGIMPHKPVIDDTSTDVRAYVEPRCDPVGLIRSSLLPASDDTWEDRYLLFLTENYTALQTLQHHLFSGASEPESKQSIKETPLILFGSSFPKDREYTQTCRNINEIKLCMETGRMVILLNLENLYESLYDALNQYYLYHGGKRYVDLGLQSHRMKCQVHKDFRLILIAESKKVYNSFPTPLINRLEKHFVLSKTLLHEWQLKVLTRLEDWIKTFVKVTNKLSKASQSSAFKPTDCFVGFQSDTSAAVLLSATANVKQKTFGFDGVFKIRDSNSNNAILSEIVANEVLLESKKLLLRTATPDAIIRLECTDLPKDEQTDLHDCYFEEQYHYSLHDLLLSQLKVDNRELGIAIQVTTHGPLLNDQEIEEVYKQIKSELNKECFGLSHHSLQEFDTEEDFVTSCGKSFESKDETLLVIQCDSGHLNGDLIACARYRICDLRKEKKNGVHVVFIVHLPRNAMSSTFVGFQGEPWTCYHVDDFLEIDDYGFQLTTALQKTVSELFYSGEFVSESLPQLPQGQLPQVQLPPGQCKKLNICIQSAASQSSGGNADRALKQIDLLLSVPTSQSLSQNPLSTSTFHGVLVRNIFRQIGEIEQEQQKSEDESIKWYLEEALSTKALQHGGTFRNTLSLKIEELLVPLLADYIKVVDMNCNLDLMSDACVSSLWIAMFHHFFTGGVESHLADLRSNLAAAAFNCRMPFHWKVQNIIDSSIHQASLDPERCFSMKHFEAIFSIAKESLLGGLLSGVNPDNCAQLEQCYLHDFVRSVLPTSLKTTELASMDYELIEAALHGATTGMLDSVQVEEHSLLAYITVLHIASKVYQEQLSQFREVVSYAPAILRQLCELKDKICHSPDASKTFDLMLHVHAVELALSFMLEDLNTVLLSAAVNKLCAWLHDVQEISLVCTSVLDTSSNIEMLISMRRTWMKVRTLQVLIEHIVLEEQTLIQYARRMNSIFRRKKTDSTDDETFKKVLSLVNKLRAEIQRKLIVKRTKSGMTVFMMELIACLCFGRTFLPDASLREDLVGYAMPDTQDVDPAVHLFLFQEMLAFNSDNVGDDQVQEFLSTIVEKAFKYRQENKECCLRFLHSFELSFSSMSIDRVSWALTCLKSEPVDISNPSDLIIAIGTLRSFLVHFCSLLRKATLGSGMMLQSDKFSLCDIAEQILENDVAVNFTVKTFVREYGFQALHELSILNEPAVEKLLENFPSPTEGPLIDPLFVYGRIYNDQRERLASAVLKNDLQELDMDIAPKNVACLILTLNERILSLLQECEDPNKMEACLKKYILQCPSLKEPILQDIAQRIIDNSLPQWTTVESDSTVTQVLSPLTLHVVSVVVCSSTNPLLSSLKNFLCLPQGFENSLLPTMPDESTIDWCGEVWCSKGHSSVLTTKGDAEGCCSQCGEQLQLARYRTNPGCLRGHMFGDPDRRNEVPIPVRDLSSAACHVIRIFIHALLFWNCCANPKGEQHDLIIKLLKLDPNTRTIAQICWQHLKQDLALLSMSLGRSLEEAGLVVHIILKDIMYKADGVKGDVQYPLDSMESRNQWEKAFDEGFILPVLQELDTKVQTALNSNSRKSHDKCYTAVYKTLPNDKEISVALWSSPQYLTVDQLMTNMSSVERDGHGVPPLLKLFLHNEPLLRATQFLPDIVGLHTFLHSKFHLSQSVSEAECTFNDLLDQVKENDAVLWNTLKMLIASFHDAWRLVKETFYAYATTFLQVKPEYVTTSIDRDTKLKYLIPTAEGPGASTAAFIRFLVSVHNTFVTRCNISSNTDTGTRGTAPRFKKERHVNLSQIQPCHMIKYETKILLLFSSYGCISERSKTDFTDLNALEKHIMHKFVRGKPIIVIKHQDMLVTYKQDVDISTAQNIAAVREKVTPQRELALEVEMQILHELNEMQHLHEAFEIVKIVLQFLATGGGTPSRRLGDYVKHTLKMNRHYLIIKALERCSLQNVGSLWRILGTQLARCHVDEEPFDQIPEWLKEEFIPEDKEEFSKIIATIDVDRFLKVLFDFIERSLRLFSEEDKDEELGLCLEKHIKQNELRPLSRLNENFPKAITIAESVAVWRYVARLDQ